MFRIRRVYDDITPANKDAIAEVQNILRYQFPRLLQSTVAKLPEQLRNPMKYRFRSILFVAEGSKGKIDGFALLYHAPFLKFCFLDYISAAEGKTGGGIGGALYERVREEALDLKTIGLFFECLPDDPRLSCNPEIRKQNVAHACVSTKGMSPAPSSIPDMRLLSNLEMITRHTWSMMT